MSLPIRIIPCLDVANGRVVKGVNFQNLVELGDPIELATRYYQEGADELTFLDVSATIEERETTLDLVRKTAEQIFVPLTVGGGIRSADDVSRLLAVGADKVSVNSAAIARPVLIDEIANRHGNQVLVLSLDVKSSNSEFRVTTHGGRVMTDLVAFAWAKEAIDRGVGELLINSIDADGTKSGFSLDLIAQFSSELSVPIVASGGAGSTQHFVEAAAAGADAVLAASVFHNGEITISEVKQKLFEQGFNVRRTKIDDEN